MLKTRLIFYFSIFGLCFISCPAWVHAESTEASVQCPAAVGYDEGEILETSATQKVSSYVEKSFSNHYSPGHPDYGYGDYQVESKSNIYHMRIQSGDWVYSVERKLRPNRQPAWKAGDLLYLRVSKDNMYVKKPDGRELKMKIVQRKIAPSTTISPQ